MSEIQSQEVYERRTCSGCLDQRRRCELVCSYLKQGLSWERCLAFVRQQDQAGDDMEEVRLVDDPVFYQAERSGGVICGEAPFTDAAWLIAGEINSRALSRLDVLDPGTFFTKKVGVRTRIADFEKKDGRYVLLSDVFAVED